MEIKNKNPWYPCLSASLFFFYSIFQMGLFNSLGKELIATFNINPVQLGTLSSLYFYANAIFILPIALLLDKFSNRVLLLSIMLICIISTFVFSLTESFWLAGLCRIIWGISNACAFLGCMRLSTVWFSKKQTTLVMSILITIGMSGGIVAQTPFTLLISTIGWQNASLLFSGLGVIIWILMFLFVFDKDKNNKNKILSPQKMLMIAISNIQNWLCGLYTALLNLPILLLGSLWGNLYLTHSYHISATQASFITSFLFIGLIFGSPLIGFLSNRVITRHHLMITAAVLIFLIASLIIYISVWSITMLIILFLILGILSSAQVMSYPIVTGNNPKLISSTAMSIISILINLIGAFAQFLFGWLIQQTFYVESLITYFNTNYRYALTIMPISFICSIVIAMMIQDKGSKISKNIFS
jgi:predicted MFS family arabinose efflux permease